MVERVLQNVLRYIVLCPLICFVLIFPNHFACAENTLFKNTDDAIKECYKIEREKSDSYMFQCMKKDFDEINKKRKKLTNLFENRLKNKNEQTYFKRFQYVDVVWIKYRNDQCNFMADAFDGVNGEQDKNLCLIDLDLNRIYQIQYLLDQYFKY